MKSNKNSQGGPTAPFFRAFAEMPKRNPEGKFTLVFPSGLALVEDEKGQLFPMLSSSPALFTKKDALVKQALIKDGNGHSPVLMPLEMYLEESILRIHESMQEINLERQFEENN